MLSIERAFSQALILVLFNFLGNSPGLTQTAVLTEEALTEELPFLELGKSPKSCFSEKEELPPPPLSQTEPSIPNLWLAKELYGTASQHPIPPNNSSSEIKENSKNIILETWFIEPKTVRLAPGLTVDNLVTLIVDRYVWRHERYMGQYVFVHRFGAVVRDYGYNLRVCNREGDWLAHYICDFETAPLECRIQLKTDGLRIRDFKLFEVKPAAELN
ncbi:MAG: hypothetical protein ACRC8A_16710 [Microcoleaceae cyanobacterium]